MAVGIGGATLAIVRWVKARTPLPYRRT